MKGNCELGCKHCQVRDIYKLHEFKDENGEVYGKMNEHVGYEYYCDKEQVEWKEWHERNAKHTYEEYKTDYLPCFEPTELTERLNGMIEIAKEILNK